LQLPQCVVSHTSSQQAPSQQAPSQHVCPAAQQVPLQPVCPAGQQAPSEHVSPVGHVTAPGQFEQFALLVNVQTPLQVIYPSGQHSTPTVPGVRAHSLIATTIEPSSFGIGAPLCMGKQ